MTEKTYKFKEQVEDLFYSISGYYEDVNHKEVGFNIRSGFNAESLFKLSDLLGTGTIHSSPEASEGSDTYGSTLNAYIEIHATNVKF